MLLNKETKPTRKVESTEARWKFYIFYFSYNVQEKCTTKWQRVYH